MSAPTLSTKQQHSKKKPIINMTSWMRNHLANLNNAVAPPVAETRDTFAEKMHSIRETASLLYITE